MVAGEHDREAALRNYAEFVDGHERKFRWMLRAQKLLPKMPARVQRAVIRACGRKRFVHWAFDHYLRIAPPEFAGPAPRNSGEREAVQAAA